MVGMGEHRCVWGWGWVLLQGEGKRHSWKREEQRGRGGATGALGRGRGGRAWCGGTGAQPELLEITAWRGLRF